MKDTVSILRIFFSIYLFCCVLFAGLGWKDLLENDSNATNLLALFLYGIIGLLIDFVFSVFVKNRKDRNVFSIIIVIIFSCFLLIEFNII